MSDRHAPSEPYAAWATVCFGGARTGGAPRADGSDGWESWDGSDGSGSWEGGDGSGGRSSFVVWRSDAAHGPALVRSDPLLPSAGRCPYPSPCSHAPGPLPCDVHLRVDADVDGPERTGLAAHADVLVSRVPLPPGPAQRRVRGLLADHPGCLAAAVPATATATACVVGVRDRGGAVSFVRPQRGRNGAPVPPHAVVSVVHAWVVSGRPPHALRSVLPAPRR